MITDTEIKVMGIKFLSQHLGDVGAERFVALIQREAFDYTEWHKGIDKDLTINEISSRAMDLSSESDH